MKNLSLILGLATLTGAATAQISANDIVIAVDTGFSGVGLKIVNYKTGMGRDLASCPGGGHSIVALSDEYPGEIWGRSSRPTAGFQPPIDHYNLNGEAWASQGAGTTTVPLGIWGRPNRYHTYRGDVLYTISGGGAGDGLHRRARDGKSHVQVVATSDAYDIAVLGDIVYLTRQSALASDIVFIDMTATTPTATKLNLTLDPNAPSGSVLPTKFKNICAKGPQGIADSLMLVDDTGVIYEIKPKQSSWNVTTANLKGQAAPVAIAWHPIEGVLVATDKSVYNELNYILPSPAGKPFYTTTFPIYDLALGLGGVRVVGTGCQGSNSKTPHMVYGGAPFQGNQAFSVKMEDGLPNAMAHLVIGLSDTFYGGNPLPLDLAVIGATGCKLYTDIAFDLVFKLDGNGAASIPAPVPVSSTLVGTRVFVQFGLADAAANNTGLTTSDALQLNVR